MARQANQKLKILYLLEILRRETDEEHPLTLQQIIDLLAQKGRYYQLYTGQFQLD